LIEKSVPTVCPEAADDAETAAVGPVGDNSDAGDEQATASANAVEIVRPASVRRSICGFTGISFEKWGLNLSIGQRKL
jgi:hypothetical protein